MQKNIGLVCGIALLLASCGSNGPSPVVTAPTSNITEIPDVPRVLVSPSAYVCPAATASVPLSRILGSGHMLDHGTHINPRLQPQTQLPDTLQDMLYSSKSIINNMYFGYSTVDLDAVHKTTYTNFKKEFPKTLNSYNLYALSTAQNDNTDGLMNDYIDSIKDGHTFYMNRAETLAEKQGSSPSPVFGISLDTVPKKDGLILTSVRLDGPAWKASLRRGDVILSVNGTSLTRTSDNDKDQLAAFNKVLTAARLSNKPVQLLVSTAGAQRTVTVTPAVLQGTSMPWGELRTENGKKHYYLRIPTFMSVAPERTDDTAMPISEKVHALVAEAQSLGADDIVIDLRGNGGGMLVEFVGIAAAFAPDLAGESTHYADGSSYNFTYKAGKVLSGDTCGYNDNFTLHNPVQWKGKVAVLVNGSSASASEMFSTNMQAAGIKVIGTNTYGVGNTSTYHMDLPGERSMSITAGRAYINGKAVAEHITPDIQSADDLAQLANTGVDNTLQVAFDALK